ncbi:Transcriptional regulatory protein, C terminal [Hydrocarboniphaga daqingensis]|uniref:Transcriptional regulatory protein, C terminal n=1 Tax=Hydrocarboniphaga daqingensis TaxID=490188 RepID=A0A1M5QP54_9GAMM|nr:AAA family ATPase [Hydrocarboniphaga daqingensis]SHH15651.1 Transcriptional regulatory protein, C terminal [Hydrocarboniphaga daqingensis]
MAVADTLSFGPFRLHGRNGPLLHGDQEVKLQPRTMALLWALASRPGEVVTKAQVLDAVWPRQAVSDNALSFQVQALRKALGDDTRAPRYVLTAHRVGFRFGVPVIRPDALADAAPDAEPQADGDAASAEDDESLVGRDAELLQLNLAWERALTGRTDVVFVSGETGVGKSATLRAFQQRVRLQQPQAVQLSGHCLEGRGISEPYLPVIEALRTLLRDAPDSRPMELARHLAPSWLLLMPDLIDAADVALLRQQNAGVRPERMLRELAELLEQLSLPHGVLLTIEDLHWADRATLDWIGFLAQRSGSARMMVLASLRPTDAIIAAHPVSKLMLALKARQQASELPISGLSVDAVRRYLSARLDLTAYSDDLPQRVLERSGGLPLFMVQITDYLQRHPDPSDLRGAQLNDVIPEALNDLISLQLDDLSPEQRLLLEGASVAGADFSAAAAAAAAGRELDAVEPVLEQLARHRRFIEPNGLSIWPDGTTSGVYRFRHEMYSQVLRRQLLDSQRARMHRQIAERCEAAYGTRTAEIAGELALHFERGGWRSRALPYRIQTARNALVRVAYDALAREIEMGLALLDALPPGPERDESELALRVLAVTGLQSEFGYASPRTSDHIDRLIDLTTRCRNPELLELAHYCIWMRLHFGCRFSEAVESANRFQQLGLKIGSPLIQASGDTLASLSLHLHGRFVDAMDRNERAIGLLDQAGDRWFQNLSDVRGTAYTGRALLQWLLGYPDRALETARTVYAKVKSSGNPYAHCIVHVSSVCAVLMYRRDWSHLLVEAEIALQRAEQYGHRESRLWSRRYQALALAMLGEHERGLSLLWQALAEMREQGNHFGVPLDYLLGAECCLQLGDVDRARLALDEANTVMSLCDAVAFKSEALRLEGELRLAGSARHDRTAERAAEDCMTQALQLASARQAPLLQLRAALSLGRLWRGQGRNDAAHPLVKTIYDGFVEGHDTVDLRAARQFLDPLV